MCVQHQVFDAVRRSRQSNATNKGHSKNENVGGGPTVKDPEDGTIRTPKGLLTAGPIQVPAKHIAGLMSTLNDEGLSRLSHVTGGSDTQGEALPSFPSFGNFSTIGSTPSASEAGDDLARRTLPGEASPVRLAFTHLSVYAACTFAPEWSASKYCAKHRRQCRHFMNWCWCRMPQSRQSRVLSLQRQRSLQTSLL